LFSADLHDEYAGWAVPGPNGRAINRDGPSVSSVLLGHRPGGVQRLGAALLPADDSSHGGSRRPV